MTAPTSLEVTLERLDRIVEDACTERSLLGIFPAMYRSVTAAVRDAVRTGGFFDDDERVEHLTVVFADLYFVAYDSHRRRDPAAVCWSVAFDAAEGHRRRMILQRLLLGMNAHINLDLGLATVSAAGHDLAAVQADFVRVNEILFQILDNLQGGLGAVSPRMATLDRLGGQWDERLMRVGIRSCRDLAWRFANRLVEDRDPDAVTRRRDADTAWMARAMLRPWSPVNLAARLVVGVESRDIPAIVAALDRRSVDLEEAEKAAIADSSSVAAVVTGDVPSLYQAAHRRKVRRHYTT